MHKSQTLTVVRLREMVTYAPETGEFRWRFGRPGASAGAAVGTTRPDGYVKICIDGIQVLAHRAAWAHVTGEWPEHEIDHKNLNPSDNSWDNLRPAERWQNHANRPAYKNNTSGFKGVSWQKARSMWQAQISHRDRNYSLGVYPTREEAHAVYVKAAAALKGEFGRAA